MYGALCYMDVKLERMENQRRLDSFECGQFRKMLKKTISRGIELQMKKFSIGLEKCVYEEQKSVNDREHIETRRFTKGYLENKVPKNG